MGTSVIYHNATPGEATPLRSWRSDHAIVESRSVCAICNNGWMSKVESAAKPILSRLINGAHTTMKPADSNAVARWIALKAVLQMHSRYRNTFQCAWIEEFVNSALAPPSWRIWLAKARAGDEIWFGATTATFRVQHRLGPFPVKYDGFISTVAIGHFVGQVIGASPHVGELRKSEEHFLAIWPPRASRTLTTWPPHRLLTNTQIHRLISSTSEG